MAAVWTDAGQAKTVTIMGTDGTMKWVEWGSSGTAPAVTQTQLVAANPEARTNGTMSAPAGNTRRVTGTIEATASRTVQEVGVFDASTAGNMGIRATFTSKSLVAGDRIRFTIDLVLKDSSE